MRHAIRSMFESVLGVRFMISVVGKTAPSLGNCSQMLTLSASSLCHISGGGGGGEDLPKGGW